MHSMLPTRQPTQSSRICTPTSRPTPAPTPTPTPAVVAVAVAVALPLPPPTSPRVALPYPTSERANPASHRIASHRATSRHISTRLASPHLTTRQTRSRKKHLAPPRPSQLHRPFDLAIDTRSTADHHLRANATEALFASGSGEETRVMIGGACHRRTVRCAVRCWGAAVVAIECGRWLMSA
jgi:hypothetical protein